jgi:hypothetical protein
LEGLESMPVLDVAHPRLLADLVSVLETPVHRRALRRVVPKEVRASLRRLKSRIVG